ncbi:MAG: hypothetical protein JRJ02_16220 [Deltaproteobacteria bacterium]|nr:hypothetical protein [Deltaproteobacteria bacterium]
MMDVYRAKEKSCPRARIPALGVIRWLLIWSVIWIGLTGTAHSGGVPDEAFFMDYMQKKVDTFSKFKKMGIQPYLDMTLENNTVFLCFTPNGEEVDFEGYLDIYSNTLANAFFIRIKPVSASVQAFDYTWQRIKADDEESLLDLKPKNVEKYFGPKEDKWIVTEIFYP